MGEAWSFNTEGGLESEKRKSEERKWGGEGTGDWGWREAEDRVELCLQDQVLIPWPSVAFLVTPCAPC